MAHMDQGWVRLSDWEDRTRSLKPYSLSDSYRRAQFSKFLPLCIRAENLTGFSALSVLSWIWKGGPCLCCGTDLQSDREKDFTRLILGMLHQACLGSWAVTTKTCWAEHHLWQSRGAFRKTMLVAGGPDILHKSVSWSCYTHTCCHKICFDGASW
jgi:hypothetical protein